MQKTTDYITQKNHKNIKCYVVELVLSILNTLILINSFIYIITSYLLSNCVTFFIFVSRVLYY